MNQLKKDLAQIQSNLDKYSYEEFNLILSQLLPQVPINTITSDNIPRMDKGFSRNPSLIYRARPNNLTHLKPSLSMPWSHIKDISIVPEKDIDKVIFGRANKEKQPRFYASNDWHIACYETIWHKFPLQTLENDQNLTLGIWKIDQPLILAFIPFSKNFIDRIRKPGQKIYEDIDALIISYNNQIEKMLKCYSKDMTKDKFLIDFFSDQFAKLEINNIKDYFFSNYYCDQVFDRCPNEKGINDIDGIIFPSVSFSYQYYNVVLHPRCLSKIRFIEAMYVWVTYSKDTKDMNYYPLEQHVIADSTGRLIWNLFKQKY